MDDSALKTGVEIASTISMVIPPPAGPIATDASLGWSLDELDQSEAELRTFDIEAAEAVASMLAAARAAGALAGPDAAAQDATAS